MSQLTENPELMLEVLAILTRRAGGYLEIDKTETLGPFSLMSRFDRSTGKLYLALEGWDGIEQTAGTA